MLPPVGVAVDGWVGGWAVVLVTKVPISTVKPTRAPVAHSITPITKRRLSLCTSTTRHEIPLGIIIHEFVNGCTLVDVLGMTILFDPIVCVVQRLLQRYLGLGARKGSASVGVWGLLRARMFIVFTRATIGFSS